ncbi:SARNP family protein [Megaselia abdita]
MADNDITKMKVADLKRELKLRGLSINGNKNELQDRLQTALLEGDLSFEDTAITGEDLLDDDILTDEEKPTEAVENDQEKTLLKSPSKETSEDKPEESEVTEPNVTKKVVLKRKILTSATSENVEEPSTAKENTHPEKSSKLETESLPNAKTPVLWSNLSDEERKNMRSKKFGGSSVAQSEPSTTADSVPSEQSEKQIELLKKRAERFGCVTSSKIANLEEKEKLEKRKERFGGGGGGKTTTITTSDYAEKAKQRLERFKN